MQTRIAQVEKRLQLIKSRSDGLKDEQETLTEEYLKLKQQVKSKNNVHKEQEVFVLRGLMDNSLHGFKNKFKLKHG